MGVFTLNNKRRRANALMKKYYSGMIDEGSWKHASGDIAVFNTKYRRDLKSLIVQLEPIQAGSGDPSPDNVRPISGWTGATITRTGKNLLPNEATSRIVAEVTATVSSDGSITLNGTAKTSVNLPIYGSWVNDLKPFPYSDRPITLSGCPSGGGMSSYRLGGYLYKNGVYTGTGIITTGEPITRQNIDFNQIYFVLFIYSGYEYNNVTFRPMIEYGTEATEYEPYKGATYPISWETEAGTVYSGKLDTVSGMLTVDMAMKVYDGSADEYWEYYSVQQGNLFRTVLADAKPTPIIVDAYCNRFKNSIENQRTDFTLSSSINSFNYDFIYNAATDLTEWRNWLANNPVQLVYRLATPLTYQLTPQQIQTLIGENVIWSDAGPVSVEYWS